jgi:hypothetical protein
VGLLHINFAATDKSSVANALGQFVTRCAEHISMAIANVKLRDELHDQSIRKPMRRFISPKLVGATAWRPQYLQ